jgi:hypothetical protein
MGDATNRERQRRWYARQKAGLTYQPLTCQHCGSNNSGKHGPLCRACWIRFTPEGRAVNLDKVRRSRARNRPATDCDNL